MPSGSLQDVRLGTLTQRFLHNGMEQRYELIFNKELIDDILIDQCSFRPSAARVSGPHSVYPLRLEHHVNNPSFPNLRFQRCLLHQIPTEPLVSDLVYTD